MKKTSRVQAQSIGLKRYFSGKMCPKGHTSERFVTNGGCVTCSRDRFQKNRKKYPSYARGNKYNSKRSISAYRASRLEAVRLLGNKCGCCKEDEKSFLCIDHINGGGNQHRKMTRKDRIGKWICEQININGARRVKEHFRVLCANCNQAHALLGYCPHKGGH